MDKEKEIEKVVSYLMAKYGRTRMFGKKAARVVAEVAIAEGWVTEDSALDLSKQGPRKLWE